MSTSSAAPVMGRGRGRERGMLSSGSSEASPKPGLNIQKDSPPSPSKSDETKEIKPPAPIEEKAIPPSEDKPAPSTQVTPVAQDEGVDNVEKLKGILKAIDRLPMAAVYTQVIVKDMKTMNTERDMEQLVKLLSEKTMSDPDYARKAAIICNAIWNEESLHNTLRTPLLTTVQKFYTKRDQLRKERREKYYGLSMFLCVLYANLRIKGNSLKPLVNPIFVLLKEVMGADASEEDIGYFYSEFELVGAVMQNDDKMKLEQILNMVREKVITGCKSPLARCQLVKAIELYAAGFVVSSETELFYDDLTAEIMSR